MQSEKFYRIVVNTSTSSRWYLGSPLDAKGSEIDPRVFTQGVRIDNCYPAFIKLRQLGEPLDFNFADFDMVVVTEKIYSIINEYAVGGIQEFPVRLAGGANKLVILNVCNLASCIDERSSHYMKWSDADGRPDKVGQYRMITKLQIDPKQTAGYEIFRLREWPIAMIISEKLKKIFESNDVTGIAFIPVC